MEVRVICREMIKPSKPTPSHLSTYKLSAMDQLAPSMYVPVLLAYPNRHKTSNLQQEHAEISKKMKISLSQTLTHYYPLAGRTINGISIDCNDSGALFSEAHVDIRLDDILQKPESLKMLDSSFHHNLQWRSSAEKELLTVFLTFFSCGGFVVGMCVSHKFGDASTIFSFLSDWAKMAMNLPDPSPPQLKSATVFPTIGDLGVPEIEPRRGEFVTRRFVFSPSKITSLKACVSDLAPTRVEVVTALIFKCVYKASNKGVSSDSMKKPSLLAQIVNIRNMLANPLPEKSIGNIVWFFPVMIKDENDTNLSTLVGQMKEQLSNLRNYAKNLDGNQWFSVALDASNRSGSMGDGIEGYKCSSWCGFPFYEVDFGWGEPLWVSTGLDSPLENNIILIDTKTGRGIEAYVTLKEETMAALEGDMEFLEFVSLNHPFPEEESTTLKGDHDFPINYVSTAVLISV